MDHTFELTADGSVTLYVPALDEHYHSVKGARTESQHVFVDMGLAACPAPRPLVLEVGLGTGLNAWLTWMAAERHGRPTRYVGLELHPLPLADVACLHYTDDPRFLRLHEAPWGQEVTLSDHFSLLKLEADFTAPDIGLRLPREVDVVYLDAFAPEKQPDMWTPRQLALLYDCLKPGGLLTTYCAKGAVRRALQAVGFAVERLPGPPGGKREILRARRPGAVVS